jgi:hypothetical protein
MFFPASEWFAAFLLTLVIEIPITVVLLRRAVPDLPRLLLLVVFANLVTHPAVWFVFTQLFLIGTPEYTLAAEAWAVAIEALFYAVTIRGLAARRAITVALAANVASFAVGRLVNGLGWDVL